jgi:26S proteasome regulatory subunit N5
MIQECINYVQEVSDLKTKLELIETLRTVTDGKIFVEVERARLTRLLSKIKEDQGDIVEAADLLQELQVETFGSMERREKTDFILEQMRLCFAKKDYSRGQIISKKIGLKFFEDVANEDLKIRFYRLMIEHSLHTNNFLGSCKHYRHLYDTKSIKENDTEWQTVLAHIVVFIILSPFDNEQSDLIHRIKADGALDKIPMLRDMLKLFTTKELMRWVKIDEIYGPTLKSMSIFDLKTEAGQKRYKTLHERIVEHVLDS